MPTYPIRRRPRECKTCLPCRASKVRCDRNVPCGNCVKRNFNCTYGRPPSKDSLPASLPATTTATIPQLSQFSTPSASYTSPSRGTSNQNPDAPYGSDSVSAQDPLSGTVVVSQGEWDEISGKVRAMESILGDLNLLFQTYPGRKLSDPDPDGSPTEENEEVPPRTGGINGSGDLRTGSVHIGSRSALVDILDKSKDSEDTAQALPKDDLLAELALGNEASTYPFVDLWSSDPYTFNIAGVCGVLPDDEQCRRFLGFYKDIGAVLYPVLPDIAKLEEDMNLLLRGRFEAGGEYRPAANGLMRPFGMSLDFLSLLFAVLASGCQLSDLPGTQRELTSWVYVSCSYQCLRMLNYVAQPSIEVVEILLIISNVLSYNMNAGASYTLLGMTERMCMVLGLHVETPGFSRTVQTARRRVWWAMAFQNTHFSLAYDRPSITMISQPEIPYDSKSMPGHRSYFETLSRVVSLVLEMLRGRMYPHHSQLRFHEINDYKQRMARIISEATPHLRYREHCVTLAEHIERTELLLHSSYFLSVMCRVSLDPDAHLDDQRRAIIREDCLASLIKTIEAFVELHSINSHCSRSWISLQRTIASAFLLVANVDDHFRAQTQDLIQKLEIVISDHVYARGGIDQSNRTDSAKHLASSLRALREVSAAFNARKTDELVSETANPTIVIPSPVSIPASGAPSVIFGYGVPTDDRDMRDILSNVSDVMLFPSMSAENL